jgi:PDZ domain-containing protein
VTSRARIISVCSALVVALLAVAALTPLPITIAVPGLTANVLGSNNGQPVITITGAKTRMTSGQLRLVTIAATEPGTSLHLTDAIQAWFRADEAVMPRSAVYPSGSLQQIKQQNQAEMKQSQDAATAAALGHLHMSPSRVKVALKLADVGGPSAGLMFTLGIIDLINGNGKGGDLSGGRNIAGTGTITAGGTVGAVGGVQLKEQAARRDGATVFLAPQAECSDAKVSTPKGLQVIPVTSLDNALAALSALNSGGKVPAC